MPRVSLPVLNYFYDLYIRARSTVESQTLDGLFKNLSSLVIANNYSMQVIYNFRDGFISHFVDANNTVDEVAKTNKWIEIMFELAELGCKSQRETMQTTSGYSQVLHAMRTFIFESLKKSPVAMQAIEAKIKELNENTAKLDASRVLRYLTYLFDVKKLDEKIIKSTFPQYHITTAAPSTSVRNIYSIFPAEFQPEYFKIYLLQQHSEMRGLSFQELIDKVTEELCRINGLIQQPKTPVNRSVSIGSPSPSPESSPHQNPRQGQGVLPIEDDQPVTGLSLLRSLNDKGRTNDTAGLSPDKVIGTSAEANNSVSLTPIKDSGASASSNDPANLTLNKDSGTEAVTSNPASPTPNKDSGTTAVTEETQKKTNQTLSLFTPAPTSPSPSSNTDALPAITQQNR
jgi:hypothetical protein